jgi:carbohydrate-binding DOMON domain-containing protein
MFDVNDWLVLVHILGAAAWAALCVFVPGLILVGRQDRLALFGPWIVAGLALYAVVTAIGMVRLNRTRTTKTATTTATKTATTTATVTATVTATAARRRPAVRSSGSEARS